MLNTPELLLCTTPALFRLLKVIVPELVRPVRPESVPLMVLLPVTAKPPLVTVSWPAAVMAPLLLTLSLLVPLTWKFRKSAVLPAPLTGSLRPR